jgi:hypothetical protein
MMLSTKLSVRIGLFSIASLVSATLLYLGCSIHQDSLRDGGMDAITHLLAGGTYLSTRSPLIGE